MPPSILFDRQPEQTFSAQHTTRQDAIVNSVPVQRLKIETLLHAPVEQGRAGVIARTSLAGRHSGNGFAHYLDAVDGAVAAYPPPFDSPAYAELYEQASADGHWLAISLMTNAEREGDGATRLWSLAACASDERHRALLKKHAVDESRHATAYLTLLDLTFPGSVTAEFREELDGLSPKFSMRQDVRAIADSPYARIPELDDFVQMNIAEIRTTIHHLMQRDALQAHCPPEHWPRAEKVLDSLLLDELDHVGYTAEIIETMTCGENAAKTSALYGQRLNDFNKITLDELSKLVFD